MKRIESIKYRGNSNFVINEFISYLQRRADSPRNNFIRLAERICNNDKDFDVEKILIDLNLLDILPYNENLWLINKMDKSVPTDLVHLDFGAGEKIVNIWQEFSIEPMTIPSDIIFSGTIPLMDCEVQDDSLGTESTIRVVIFENYYQTIMTSTRNNYTTIGVLLMPCSLLQCEDPMLDNLVLIIPIKCQKGNNSILIAYHQIGYMGRHFKQRNDTILKNIQWDDLKDMAISCLMTWYGIQIALLHPMVQTIFTNSKPVEMIMKPVHISSSPKKRTKVRYIKKHIINLSNINESLKCESSSIERKTMIWYVIGHWRDYKGKKIFIKGYWKGPLRKMKGHQCYDQTDRVI